MILIIIIRGVCLLLKVMYNRMKIISIIMMERGRNKGNKERKSRKSMRR